MAARSKYFWLGIFLLIPILLLALGVLGQVNNLTQAVSYTTIQPALDAANPGDIIAVDPGIYKGTLVIDKSLSLHGSGQELTILDVSDGSTWGIYVKVNLVSLAEFTVRGGASNDNHGIYYQPGVSGQTVTNVTVSGCGRTGFHMIDANNLAGKNIITNLSSTGNGTGSGGFGIALSSMEEINIKVLSSGGNSWGDFAIIPTNP